MTTTLLSPHSCSFVSFTPNSSFSTFSKTTRSTVSTATLNNITLGIQSHSSPTRHNNPPPPKKSHSESLSLCTTSSFCLCGRRRLIESLGTAFLPVYASNGSDLPPHDAMAVLNRVHPPKPDWYEELYALILDKASQAYEAEIARYKSQLFANLRGKVNEVLEIGIGTGPNLKYYANDTNVHVFGIDPNRKMEKYAQAAAEAAGLPPGNFKFIQAVAEGLPFSDASVDAVVGTLVLCSVKDVDFTLQEVRRVLRPGGLYIFVEHVAAKDGTILRFVQGVLNPLQQIVSDGCHLTRETGKNISEAGFSFVDINKATFSTASIVNPQVYGMACK